MSLVKSLYMAAHEAEIEAYMDSHPEATEEEAYDATSEAAYTGMTDQLADHADHLRDQAKEQGR